MLFATGAGEEAAELKAHDTYPDIADYGLVGDCHTTALVSRDGSVDWCCLPRLDSPSVFGRLLDWRRGGYFRLGPEAPAFDVSRRYLEDTLVLETTFQTPTGVARVTDFFAMRRGGRHDPHRQLVRVAEGVTGEVTLSFVVTPRFAYGSLTPWLRMRSHQVCHAIGGDQGLLVYCERGLARRQERLEQRFTVRAGERVRTFVQFFPPEYLFPGAPDVPDPRDLDRRLEETVAWWHRWVGEARHPVLRIPAVRRSAIVLKALTNAPTGAIAAAATTSLPEEVGGERNWDYRFSWIRDSVFTVRCFSDIGHLREADRFRAFMQRSAAGSARDLQVLYGIGGERNIEERVLPLEGYRGSRPVRVGNAAAGQVQLDAYGELVLLTWHWFARGHLPDEDFWRFLVELVDAAGRRWREPDHGIWEIRGEPRHFVHSKAMCWVALDRGVALAEATGFPAPVARWRLERDAIRAAVEREGYDAERGVFVQAFGSREVDAALLLLPGVGFLRYDDPRMVRTTDAVRADLMRDGFVCRYRGGGQLDGLPGEEGAFLPCTFWLAECLAHQGRLEEAEAVFGGAEGTANDLGLFAEEWDPRRGTMLGNLPQGLSHLSHIGAAMAIAQARGEIPENAAEPRHTSLRFG